VSDAARLTVEERAELSRLVARYEGLPDAPTDSIVEDIARIEAITAAAYQRAKRVKNAPSGEEQQLLDRAESLIPLMKVCMPGNR
jgi:hypothetical protein